MISLPPLVKDLRGRQFGRLTVRAFAGVRNGYAYWTCDCSCGAASREIRGKNLLAGRTVSCGCHRADSNIRKAARLRMSEEARRSAARGERVTAKPTVEPKGAAPKREKRILPFLRDRAPENGGTSEPGVKASIGPARVNESITPAAPAQSKRHSVWAAITKHRRGGYCLALRLHKGSMSVMQSRRLDSPSEARREARRIFGECDWMTGPAAGLVNQPWVLEIAEIKVS